MARYTYYHRYLGMDSEVDDSDGYSIPKSDLPIILSQGDTVEYISDKLIKGTIYLKAQKNKTSLCEECYLYKVDHCLDDDKMRCGEYILVLDKDAEDERKFNELSKMNIPLTKIRSNICNEDTCPYYSDECINTIRKSDNCLIRIMMK